MAGLTAQPIRCASFSLAEVDIPGANDIGGTTDAPTMLYAMGVWPAEKSNAGDVVVSWGETPAQFATMALSANVTATTTGTTFVVKANYARPGDLIECVSPANGTEYVLVTAISGTSLTVTRAQQSTTAIVISTTATLRIAGNMNADGATFTAGVSAVTEEKTNYFQIAYEQYRLSGSSAAGLTKWGGDPLDLQRVLAARRLRAKQGAALWHNKSATKMTNSTRGMAKGLQGFLTTNDQAITSSTIGGTTTSTVLTAAKLYKFFFRLLSAGGSNRYLVFAGETAYAAIGEALNAATTKYVLVGPQMGAVFGNVAFFEFITIHGQAVRFSLDRTMNKGTLVAIDVGQPDVAGVWIVPARGRELVDKAYMGEADLVGGTLITEWSVMVKHEETMGYIKNITSGG